MSRTRAAVVSTSGGPRRPFVAFGVQHEELDGEPVGDGVQAADEGADLAAGQALDGLTELLDGRVLKEHPGLTQAFVLAHLGEIALGRSQGVLERDDEDVAAGPMRPGASRPTTELLLE